MTREQKVALFTKRVETLAASYGLYVSASYAELPTNNSAVSVLTVNLVDIPTRPGEQVGTEYGVAPPLETK